MSNISPRHSGKSRNPVRSFILCLCLSLLWIPAFAEMTPAQASTCTNPEGVEGQIIFNRKWKVMQFCDGDKWYGMAGGSLIAAGSNGQIQFNNAGSLSATPDLSWDSANGALAINGISAFRALSEGIVSMRYPSNTGYAFIGSASGSSSNGAYISTTGRDNTTQVVGAGGIQMGVVGVSPAMSILGTSGNVGIGTHTPSAKLDIANGTLRVMSSGTQYAPTSGSGLEFFSLSNTGYIFQYNRDTSAYGQLRIHGSIVAIAETGVVGIGVNSPSYKLQVAGAVAGSSAYVNTSDERLKKDVVDIPYGLDSVLKLHPVAFEWITQDEDWAQGRKVGLIAQEAEIVLPEVVSTAGDEMGTKSIAYGDIVPVLIKAVQEQQAQIDALKAEIEALKTGH